MEEENVILSFQEGSSDKVYHAELKKDGEGWLVNFAYGRRGSALATGTKTKEAIEYDKAKKTYDKLVNSKMAKGYKTADGSTSINTTEREDTGIRPQLLNEITEQDVNQYINDDNWCAQEKYDGERRMIKKEGEVITGSNKKGFKTALPQFIEDSCKTLVGDHILDGEDLGSKIMLFDNLIYPDMVYQHRYKILVDIISDMPELEVVKTAWTAADKAAMYNRLVQEKAEGIVFKRIDATYSAGRPNSGGNQIKCKFYATASCIVNSVSEVKSSISVLVFDEKQNPVVVGNVTVYPNMPTPVVGDVVEVKYLYFYPGGSLYQSVLLGIRNDVDHDECLLSKLKEKQDETVPSDLY